MADLTPLYDALQKADAAGDTAGAKQLADYIRAQSGAGGPSGRSGLSTQQVSAQTRPRGRSFDYDPVASEFVPTGSAAAAELRNPTYGQSATSNYLAGAGKASVDIGRGIGQVGAGIADAVDPRAQGPSRVSEWRQSVADSRALDAPLMATRAGRLGYLTGSIVDTAPAAFIPGAGTILGSAAIGAGTGFIQPSASTSETLTNTGFGAALAPAAILAGRGTGALYQGARSAIEPLFQGGQQRIAARTLQAFAGGSGPSGQAAQNIAANSANILPGVAPTTAELANNAGLSQLERSLRNNPEYMNALTGRSQANRAAMTGAIKDIAGTPEDMALAMRTRAQTTQPLYEAANSVSVPADDEINSLMARPSMVKAWTRAQQLAAERGETLVQGQDVPEVALPGLLAKRNMQTPDPTQDSILQFLAKHPRGLSSQEAAAQGIDPASFPDATVGIRRAFRKNGMSFDEAAESLQQSGYPVSDAKGDYSANVLLDHLDSELSGQPLYSAYNTRLGQEADLSSQPPPDLTSLSQKASQANPKAAQAILDSWHDDAPETLSRVVNGLQGVISDSPVYSGKGLQYLKMALNDMRDTAEQRGIGAHEQSALDATISGFNNWSSKSVPQLRAADRAYADLSQPINQMQVGSALSNKLLPALSDLGNNTRLNAASYAGALRNGDKLASQVTGRDASLSDVLSGDQFNTVMQVGQQLARRANADELGRAVGSNTGQNLISQNVLRQFLGPLGLPQSMAERAAQSTFGKTLLRPMQWLAQSGEPRVMDVLAESALDPVLAKRLLAQGVDPGLAGLIWQRQGLLGSTALAAGSTANASQ